MATHIHVVLTDDISNVGKSGELVRVRPGFARNYLIPRGLAIGATAENVARIEHEKKRVEAKNQRLRAEAQELSKELSAVKLVIHRPVGEGERLYGSVTTRDLEEALAMKGYRVDRRRIESEPLKALGTFSIQIRLATSISATIEVTIAPKV